MTYNKKFLISELQRFVLENGRNPVKSDIQSKFGYSNYNTYINHFGSWNKALLAAGLNINVLKNRLTGFELCDVCGKPKSKNQHWRYKYNNQRLCKNCYTNSEADYMNGNLDPESSVGFAFISQRIVAKVLDSELKYDCNCSQGFDSAYDLYDEKLGYINVKARILKDDYYWSFGLKNKYMPDTYILLGFSKDKSNIEHAWITDSLDDLAFNKKSITMSNCKLSLKRAEPWEVDCRPYNDAYHNMSLENCSVLRND